MISRLFKCSVPPPTLVLAVIGMPIPIIVSNFAEFLNQQRERERMKRMQAQAAAAELGLSPHLPRSASADGRLDVSPCLPRRCLLILKMFYSTIRVTIFAANFDNPRMRSNPAKLSTKKFRISEFSGFSVVNSRASVKC